MIEKKIKIKLAAIARDEAAYFPEWIFHHLDFGFDEIELYINNTSDNSLAILNNISIHHPVVVTDANKLFESSTNDFQLLAYQEITAKAIKDGFTHIMFLDIDEFWTPANFKTTIKQALSLFNYPQALSLNWFIHCDETDFSRCYNGKVKGRLKILPNSHVKTIFELDAAWDKIEIHNIIGVNVKHTRGNGEIFDFGSSPHCGITDNRCIDHDYFVIHRMYRSQMEYISLLGRGRANKLQLKDNRNGYYASNGKFKNINIDEQLLTAYNDRFDAFLMQCALPSVLENSRDFIRTRHTKIITWAKKANEKDSAVFYKLFNHIELPEVVALRKIHHQKAALLSASIDLLSTPNYAYLLLLLLAKMLNKLAFNTLAQKTFLHATKVEPEVNDVKVVYCIEKALLKAKYPLTKHADIYREIAIQFRQKNELPLACAFIAKAKELRPTGPKIIKLSDQFMKESGVVNNATRNNVAHTSANNVKK